MPSGCTPATGWLCWDRQALPFPRENLGSVPFPAPGCISALLLLPVLVPCPAPGLAGVGAGLELVLSFKLVAQKEISPRRQVEANNPGAHTKVTPLCPLPVGPGLQVQEMAEALPWAASVGAVTRCLGLGLGHILRPVMLAAPVGASVSLVNKSKLSAGLGGPGVG